MRTTHLLVGLLSFATPALAQQAYLIDSNLDQLFSVNLATGAATLIGSTLNNGLDTPAGLTWRADTQTLWTVDLSGGEVGTLNLLNGTFTQVFIANPTSGWQGIDWGPRPGHQLREGLRDRLVVHGRHLGERRGLRRVHRHDGDDDLRGQPVHRPDGRPRGDGRRADQPVHRHARSI